MGDVRDSVEEDNEEAFGGEDEAGVEPLSAPAPDANCGDDWGTTEALPLPTAAEEDAPINARAIFKLGQMFHKIQTSNWTTPPP